MRQNLELSDAETSHSQLLCDEYQTAFCSVVLFQMNSGPAHSDFV